MCLQQKVWKSHEKHTWRKWSLSLLCWNLVSWVSCHKGCGEEIWVQQLVDAGLTMQANVYYKLLISWTNQKVKDTYVTRNTFDFKHGIQKKPILLPHCDRTISSCAVDVAVWLRAQTLCTLAANDAVFLLIPVTPFERSQIDAPGPCVLFATPGMLSGGLSLEVFKHWAPSDSNMIILPGCKFSLAYCLFLCLSPFGPTHVQISSKDCYHFSAEFDLMLACQSQYRQQTHSSVCKWALE